MHNKHSYTYKLKPLVRLIAVLIVECFIATSVAPDYSIRSLLGSDERTATRQLIAALRAEAPDCLAPPLATGKLKRDKSAIKRLKEQGEDATEAAVIKPAPLLTLDTQFGAGESKTTKIGRNAGIIGLAAASVLYSDFPEKRVILFGSGTLEPFETVGQIPLVDNNIRVEVVDKDGRVVANIRRIIKEGQMPLADVMSYSKSTAVGSGGVAFQDELLDSLDIQGVNLAGENLVINPDIAKRLTVHDSADIRDFIHNVPSGRTSLVFLGNLLNNIIHQEGFDWEASRKLYGELERILTPKGMIAYTTCEAYFHWYHNHETYAHAPEIKETRNVIQTLEEAGLDILFKTAVYANEVNGAIMENAALIVARHNEYDAFPDAEEAIEVTRKQLSRALPKGTKIIERTTSFSEFKNILESGKETNLVLIKIGRDRYVSFNIPGRFKDAFTKLALAESREDSSAKPGVLLKIQDVLAEIRIKRAHRAYQNARLVGFKKEEKPNTLRGIRARYLAYYQTLGHRLIPRQKLVDPRFPDVFVRSADNERFYSELRKHVATQGEYIPASQKACTVQPSHRYGDRSSRSESITHLQLFEMAAAWYTGETVDAWSILGDVLNLLESYGLDRSKLRFTVLRKGGVEPNPYVEENDLYNTWLSLGVKPGQISFKGPEDNLWVQGGIGITDLGGPDERGWLLGESTEIFYGDIEISNILFPAFIRQKDRPQGPLIPLRFKMCETVVGLDRLAMIVEKKASVFDIDSVAPLCAAIRSVVPDAIKGTLAESELDRLVKIVADDLRALIFLVTDGASLAVTKNEREESRKYSLLHVFTKELLEAMKILEIKRDTHLKYLLEQAAMPYASVYPELTEPVTLEDVGKLLDARAAQLSRAIASRLVVINKGTPGIVRKLKSNPDYILLEEDYSQLEQFGLSRNDIDFAGEFFRSCVRAKTIGEAIVYTGDFLHLASALGISYQELKNIMTRELDIKLTRDQEHATVNMIEKGKDLVQERPERVKFLRRLEHEYGLVGVEQFYAEQLALHASLETFFGVWGRGPSSDIEQAQRNIIKNFLEKQVAQLTVLGQSETEKPQAATPLLSSRAELERVLTQKAFPDNLSRKLLSNMGIKATRKRGEETIEIDLSWAGVNNKTLTIYFISRDEFDKKNPYYYFIDGKYRQDGKYKPYIKETEQESNFINYTLPDDITIGELVYLIEDIDSLTQDKPNRLKLSNLFSQKFRYIAIYLAREIPWDSEELTDVLKDKLKKQIELLYLLGGIFEEVPDYTITEFEDIKKISDLKPEDKDIWAKLKLEPPDKATWDNIKSYLQDNFALTPHTLRQPELLLSWATTTIDYISYDAHFVRTTQLESKIFLKGVEELYEGLEVEHPLIQKLIRWFTKLSNQPLEESFPEIGLSFLQQCQKRLKDATPDEEIEIVREIVSIIERFKGWQDEEGKELDWSVAFSLRTKELSCVGRAILTAKILKAIGIKEDRLYTASYPYHLFLILELSDKSYCVIETHEKASEDIKRKWDIPKGYIRDNLKSQESIIVEFPRKFYIIPPILSINHLIISSLTESLMAAIHQHLGYALACLIEEDEVYKDRLDILDMAIAQQEKAIKLNKNFLAAYAALGFYLTKKSQRIKNSNPLKAIELLSRAIFEFGKAIKLKTHFPLIAYSLYNDIGDAIKELTSIYSDITYPDTPYPTAIVLSKSCLYVNDMRSYIHNHQRQTKNQKLFLVLDEDELKDRKVLIHTLGLHKGEYLFYSNIPKIHIPFIPTNLKDIPLVIVTKKDLQDYQRRKKVIGQSLAEVANNLVREVLSYMGKAEEIEDQHILVAGTQAELIDWQENVPEINYLLIEELDEEELKQERTVPVNLGIIFAGNNILRGIKECKGLFKSKEATANTYELNAIKIKDKPYLDTLKVHIQQLKGI